LPVGQRAMAPNVQGDMELSCISCICTYDPNSAFQCFLISSLMPAIMVHGPTVTWWEIPGVMAFSKNMLCILPQSIGAVI
jgi:hypothetical protein